VTLTLSTRFADAVARIDLANSADPRSEPGPTGPRPKELVYGERMSAWLARLVPEASEALQLAVRAQHVMRWHIPRSEYAAGRDGYRQWRSRLAQFHAETVSKILREAGYDDATISRVAALVRKEKYKTDAEAQTLEDVACLVFLENHFAEFAAHKDEARLVDILQKTWRKMSARGQQAALTIELPETLRKLVEKAVSGA
jgi:hypothetical protein